MFDIIGSFLGLVSFIFLSAGFIKSSQQIRDENEIQFDGNPYILESLLNEQPYLTAGFATGITGFAVSIGDNIAHLFMNSDVRMAILIGVTLSLLGYLGMALFYIRQEKRHQQAKVRQAKKAFIQTARKYKNWARDNQEKDTFITGKQLLQDDLDRRLKKIPESDNESEQNLVYELASAQTSKQISQSVDDFLRELA